jgi:hypothetical protein
VLLTKPVTVSLLVNVRMRFEPSQSSERDQAQAPDGRVAGTADAAVACSATNPTQQPHRSWRPPPQLTVWASRAPDHRIEVS